MTKFGCPPTYTELVSQLHDGMLARVQDDVEPSNAFPGTNGVRQGCILASLMFSAILTDAFKECDGMIDFRYCKDGTLFNTRRLQAKTKVHVETIRDLVFADDCALKAGTDRQLTMNPFSSACNYFGLTIYIQKTEVLHKTATGKAHDNRQRQLSEC
jgi:hypothetical protein